MAEVELVYSVLTRNPFKVVCRIADSELSQNTSALRALNSFYTMSRDEVVVRSAMLRELPELSDAAKSERHKNWRGVPEWFSDIEAVCSTPAGSDIRPFKVAIGALADSLLAFACSSDEDQRDRFQSMFGEFAAQPQQECGVADALSEADLRRVEVETLEVVTKCLWDLAVWARSDGSHSPCPNLHKAEGGILEVARRFIYLRAHDRYEDMYGTTPTDTLLDIPAEVLCSRSEELVVLLRSLFERCEALDRAGKFSTVLNCLEPVAQLADILGEKELRKVVARFCEGLLNELTEMASSVSRGEHGEFFKRSVVSELRRWRPGTVFTDTKNRIVRIAGIHPRELA
jgi:hypothetical protein